AVAGRSRPPDQPGPEPAAGGTSTGSASASSTGSPSVTSPSASSASSVSSTSSTASTSVSSTSPARTSGPLLPQASRRWASRSAGGAVKIGNLRVAAV